MSRETAAVEDTRARVLRVSAELFAARGFDATGVEELSQAVGLGRGALYYHIKSKQDLLYAITVDVLDDALTRAAKIAARRTPVERRLLLLSVDLMEDLSLRRDAWTVSLRDWLALTPAHRAEVVDRRDRYEKIWQNVLDEGAATGVLRPVSPLVRRGILGLFNSSYLWIDRTGAVAPRAIAEAYLSLLLDGLRLPLSESAEPTRPTQVPISAATTRRRQRSSTR